MERKKYIIKWNEINFFFQQKEKKNVRRNKRERALLYTASINIISKLNEI